MGREILRIGGGCYGRKDKVREDRNLEHTVVLSNRRHGCIQWCSAAKGFGAYVLSSVIELSNRICHMEMRGRTNELLLQISYQMPLGTRYPREKAGINLEYLSAHGFT